MFQGGSHSSKLEILAEAKRKDLEASGLQSDFDKHSDHYTNFLLACRGDEQSRSPFSVSGPLSQMLVLGCLAQRLGGVLEFDRANKQITNNEYANSLLSEKPRKGWEQYYEVITTASSIAK